MKRIGTLATLAVVGSLLTASPAHGQGAAPDSLLCVLNQPPSEFEWGCFAPCMCPLLIQSPLAGDFLLRRSGIGPLFITYDVLDVRWKAAHDNQPVVITGSGTYRHGGELENMEQLTLDLSFDGGPPQHFDSGLVRSAATFPQIATRISLHGEFCHDSVLVVDSRPLEVAGAGDHSSVTVLTAAPNPFSGSTEIGFSLPHGGVVSLGVFDITGRRVRALSARESLAGGSYVRSWDGRLDSGAAAGPGLYVVRLDSPAGRTARTVAKLR